MLGSPSGGRAGSHKSPYWSQPRGLKAPKRTSQGMQGRRRSWRPRRHAYADFAAQCHTPSGAASSVAFFVESTASLYSVMILQSGMTISISVLEALLEHQNLSVDKRIFDKDMHLRPSLPRSFLLLVLIPHLQVRSFFPCCWWHQVMCLALYAAVAGPMHRL